MIILKLKSLERYNTRINYPVPGKPRELVIDAIDKGDWVRWSDVKEILERYKND